MAGIIHQHIHPADTLHHGAELVGADIVAGSVIERDAARYGVGLGVGPAGTVVPDDKHVFARGVILLHPLREFAHTLVVAHIGVAGAEDYR